MYENNNNNNNTVDEYRHAEYGAGFVACLDVNISVESRVQVGIRDVERLTSCRDVTGDPFGT